MQRPLHHPPALTAEPESATVLDGYRQNLKIKLRRGAGIDAELVAERLLPFLQSGKVQKWVLDRPLDLVGAGPGKEHDGGMGLDALHSCRSWVVSLWRGHEFHDPCLVGRLLAHDLILARQSRDQPDTPI